MALPRALSTLVDPVTPTALTEPDNPSPDRHRRVLTGVVFAAIALFALLGIGSPLLGQSVFAGTNDLVTGSPYRELPEFAGTESTNTYLDDTWDSAIPNTVAFADQLRDGDIAAWNPYVTGGVPLGATPNYALASPLTLPYYLLPVWYAPGIAKLLEIIVAVGATYLFLRRLGLRAGTGLLGGLVFATSGFMVVWTNWPQTRVAAFIPAVFWAAELLVQRGWGGGVMDWQRRARDAAVLALAVAAMLVGGFPAVTGYTLATAALYLLVRVWSTYRDDWRRAAGVLVRAGAGVFTGVLLAAVQLVPWVQSMQSAFVEGREQTPQDTLPVAGLVTSIAPWALGSTNLDRQPFWYLTENLVESMSYVGAAAVVLAVIAAAAIRRGRAILPGGVWTFLVAATAGWTLLAYVGGPPLAVLQRLPVLFSDNFVGRARSVLGFLIAVLAAVGLELLLKRRTAREPVDRRRWAIAWAALVWGGVAVSGLWALRAARNHAIEANTLRGGVDRVAHLWQELAVALAIVALALACAAALRYGRRASLRVAALVVLPLLIAGQALSFVGPYWPRSDRSTFYPVTDVHQYLGEHLGHDRFAGILRSMGRSVDAAHGLRAATGHAFVDVRYGELVRTVPGSGTGTTHVGFASTPQSITSPALDRMAVRYAVVALQEPVPGEVRAAPSTAPATTTLKPGVAVTRSVPGTGGIRAVNVTPTESATWNDAGDRIEVVVRDSSGREVARAGRRIDKTVDGQALSIPVAAEDVPAGARLTATLTLRGDRALGVRSSQGAVAVGAVAPADDGLKLVHVGSAAVYDRLNYVPRVRWASDPVDEPNATKRLALLSGGTLRPDQVVLEQAPAAGGGTALVTVTEDGYGEVEATVTANGTGYLVLADTIKGNWTATVDGAPAELLRADHAFVAIAVPDGRHTVRFAYSTPASGLGGWLSLAAALAVCTVFVVGLVQHRRRRAHP